ncbi:MAG: FAD-binding oxidoreductase, partial [Planctomycetota bacterium]
MKSYQSWGRYPKVQQQQAYLFPWRDEFLPETAPKKILPYGQGRSYGDVCLNEGGILIDTCRLRHFIAFDSEQGLITCESGVTLKEILAFSVPQGFFLPTTPGTQFITLGGAIANDVHGKNHHRAGTLGCHILQFELLRSTGERFICSPTQNQPWFKATIGGLGLTGLITWAQLRLTRIASPLIEMESIRFRNLEEFFILSSESDEKFEHTVSWIDCLARGDALGRGIFMRGNFSKEAFIPQKSFKKKTWIVPCNAPNFALNALSIRSFNFCYYHRQWRKIERKRVHYAPFFYPLDSIEAWNRIYGKRGFFQYQFVVPYEGDAGPIREILDRIACSKMGSFLAVLKTFGAIQSPGILSFPRPGITLALDFPNQGKRSLDLFSQMDKIVAAHQGVVYPAKDARMSAAHFQQFFPSWKELSTFQDPQ